MGYRSKGFWTKHYTMSGWDSPEPMKAFARSGAHLEAMKPSGALAKEIKTLVLEAPVFPSWKEAQQALDENGKSRAFH